MVAEKTVCVMMLRGQNVEGESVYAYVAVRADMIEEFMLAQQRPDFHPEDYGVVIESGVGDPSPEVRAKMEQDYGFNHEKMVFLSSESPEGDA